MADPLITKKITDVQMFANNDGTILQIQSSQLGQTPIATMKDEIKTDVVAQLLSEGGVSLGIVNIKGVVATLVDLNSISDPQINDAYQVETDDNLFYVWDGTTWVGGFNLIAEPTGVVEEGNTNAVSGGDVYDYVHNNFPTKKEAVILHNIAENGNFKNGTSNNWFIDPAFSIVYDASIEKYVVTNEADITTTKYNYQDISIPEGHTVFVSVLIKNETAAGSSVLLTLSEYGGRTTNVEREAFLYNRYGYVQMLRTVGNGEQGVRVSYQINANEKGYFTDLVVIDLSDVYGLGNEPTLVEFKKIFNESEGFFENISLLKLEASAEKKRVDAELLNKASNEDANVTTNLVDNGNFKDGVGWIKATDWTIEKDLSIDKFVATNIGSLTTYYFQDIKIPSGHKYFLSVLAKDVNYLVGYPPNAFIVTSDYGGRTTNVVRNAINWVNYTHRQLISTVTQGNQGIRVSFQVNANEKGYFTDLMVLDLTEIYGEGYEPSLEEFQAELASKGNYFEKLNILSLLKANKSYVDEQLELKADITNSVSRVEFNNQVEAIKNAEYKVEDYSLKGDEWDAGFFMFIPTDINIAYKLTIGGIQGQGNAPSSALIGVDFSNLIDMYGDGKCRLILKIVEVKPVSFMDNIKWGDNKPLFDEVGTYIIGAISQGDDVLMYLDSFVPKEDESPTNILYVDNSAHTEVELYPSSGGLIEETATRTTSSWANPYIYLQNALNDAQEGDEIWVSDSEYKPTHIQNTTEYNIGDCKSVDASFTLKNKVNILGGFKGTETNASERNGSKTILNGDINNQITTLDESILRGDRRRVSEKTICVKKLTTGSPTEFTYLDSLEMKNAGGDHSSTGAIANGSLHRKLVLQNCYIHDAYAIGEAPIYGVTILNSFIEHTETSGTGGAIMKSNVHNCIVERCSAGLAPKQGYAGGIHYSSIYNTKVNDCYAGESGGGIHSSIVHNCEVTNCQSDNNGGGMYRCTVYDSVIRDCVSDVLGGGFYNCESFRVKVYNCSSSRGGGWRQSRAYDCLSFGCIADWGGAWDASTSVNCIGANSSSLETSFSGDNINCILLNNKSYGANVAYQGSQKNCTIINCISETSLFKRRLADFTLINTLMFNNKKSNGSVIPIENGVVTFKHVNLNNAFDGVKANWGATGIGSVVDEDSWIYGITLDNLKINIPSFVGYTEDEEQIQELLDYIYNIKENLTPKKESVLIGAGINTGETPKEDFVGVKRPKNCAIGVLEPFKS